MTAVPDGKMRQAVLEAPACALAVRDVLIPRPGDDEVLVRIRVATICTMTDLHIMAGIHPPHACGTAGMLPHDLRVHLDGASGDPLSRLYPPKRAWEPVFPATMGHEAAGVVAGLGPDANHWQRLVFPGERLRIGDRVTTYRLPAGYGDYSCLTSDNVVRIPDAIGDDEASLLEPVLPNYSCLRRCWSIRPAASVAILGQGFQGLVATQLVRALGAQQIIVSDPIAAKRRLALELGADVALDPTTTSIASEVERLTWSHGVDLVVECAGIEETVQVMPYLARRGGMIAQIGGLEMPVRFDYGYIHFKHITIVPSDHIPSLREAAQQVREIFELIGAGTLRLGRLITHRFGLEDINRAFDLLRSQSDSVVKVAIDV